MHLVNIHSSCDSHCKMLINDGDPAGEQSKGSSTPGRQFKIKKKKKKISSCSGSSSSSSCGSTTHRGLSPDSGVWDASRGRDAASESRLFPTDDRGARPTLSFPVSPLPAVRSSLRVFIFTHSCRDEIYRSVRSERFVI